MTGAYGNKLRAAPDLGWVQSALPSRQRRAEWFWRTFGATGRSPLGDCRQSPAGQRGAARRCRLVGGLFLKVMALNILVSAPALALNSPLFRILDACVDSAQDTSSRVASLIKHRNIWEGGNRGIGEWIVHYSLFIPEFDPLGDRATIQKTFDLTGSLVEASIPRYSYLLATRPGSVYAILFDDPQGQPSCLVSAELGDLSAITKKFDLSGIVEQKLRKTVIGTVGSTEIRVYEVRSLAKELRGKIMFPTLISTTTTDLTSR